MIFERARKWIRTWYRKKGRLALAVFTVIVFCVGRIVARLTSNDEIQEAAQTVVFVCFLAVVVTYLQDIYKSTEASGSEPEVLDDVDAVFDDLSKRFSSFIESRRPSRLVILGLTLDRSWTAIRKIICSSEKIDPSVLNLSIEIVLVDPAYGELFRVQPLWANQAKNRIDEVQAFIAQNEVPLRHQGITIELSWAPWLPMAHGVLLVGKVAYQSFCSPVLVRSQRKSERMSFQLAARLHPYYVYSPGSAIASRKFLDVENLILNWHSFLVNESDVSMKNVEHGHSVLDVGSRKAGEALSDKGKLIPVPRGGSSEAGGDATISRVWTALSTTVFPDKSDPLNRHFYGHFFRRLEYANEEVYMTGVGTPYLDQGDECEESKKIFSEFERVHRILLERPVHVHRLQLNSEPSPFRDLLESLANEYPEQFHLYFVKSNADFLIGSFCVIDPDDKEVGFTEGLLPAKAGNDQNGRSFPNGPAFFIHHNTYLAGSVKDLIVAAMTNTDVSEKYEAKAPWVHGLETVKDSWE